MTSLALLEAEIPSPLYVTGKNNRFVFALMVAVVVFSYPPLCMDVVEVVYDGAFLKQDVGIG